MGYQSRAGRPFEVALWSNGVASAGFGVLAYLRGGTLSGVAIVVITFALLRLSLATNKTLWIAATCGTLGVALVGGGLSWLFGHVIEAAGAASILGIVGAIATSILPSWAYSGLAERRAGTRDSLVDPISASTSSSSR